MEVFIKSSVNLCIPFLIDRVVVSVQVAQNCCLFLRLHCHFSWLMEINYFLQKLARVLSSLI